MTITNFSFPTPIQFGAGARKRVGAHLIEHGCKRPLISNDWYPTFNLPQVELVTDPIARVTATGVVTADGTHREVDTIIAATGFQVQRYLSAAFGSAREWR